MFTGGRRHRNTPKRDTFRIQVWCECGATEQDPPKDVLRPTNGRRGSDRREAYGARLQGKHRSRCSA